MASLCAKNIQISDQLDGKLITFIQNEDIEKQILKKLGYTPEGDGHAYSFEQIKYVQHLWSKFPKFLATVLDIEAPRIKEEILELNRRSTALKKELAEIENDLKKLYDSE